MIFFQKHFQGHHTNAMSFSGGTGQSLLVKINRRGAWIGYGYYTLLAVMLYFKRYFEIIIPLLLLLDAGLKGVFQQIGQQYAQVIFISIEISRQVYLWSKLYSQLLGSGLVNGNGGVDNWRIRI